MELLIIIVCAGLLILGLFMLKEAFGNQVKVDKLYFPEFPKEFGEFTIFFISDIHRRTINEDLIEKVKGKAEIVIIGGDLIEKGVPFSRLRRNLQKLKEVGPTYFVWGNNDYEVDTELLQSVLQAYGVIILKYDIAIQRRNERQLAIIGVDDLVNSREPVEDILLGREKDEFRILVSHNPDIIHDIQKDNQISLILSGHTHGGQIRIFGIGPYEHGGIRKVKGTTLFISNGYGTTSLPLRLGAKAETHLIILGNSET